LAKVEGAGEKTMRRLKKKKKTVNTSMDIGQIMAKNLSSKR